MKKALPSKTLLILLGLTFTCGILPSSFAGEKDKKIEEKENNTSTHELEKEWLEHIQNLKASKESLDNVCTLNEKNNIGISQKINKTLNKVDKTVEKIGKIKTSVEKTQNLISGNKNKKTTTTNTSPQSEQKTLLMGDNETNPNDDQNFNELSENVSKYGNKFKGYIVGLKNWYFGLKDIQIHTFGSPNGLWYAIFNEPSNTYDHTYSILRGTLYILFADKGDQPTQYIKIPFDFDHTYRTILENYKKPLINFLIKQLPFQILLGNINVVNAQNITEALFSFQNAKHQKMRQLQLTPFNGNQFPKLLKEYYQQVDDLRQWLQVNKIDISADKTKHPSIKEIFTKPPMSNIIAASELAKIDNKVKKYNQEAEQEKDKKNLYIFTKDQESIIVDLKNANAENSIFDNEPKIKVEKKEEEIIKTNEESKKEEKN